MLIKMTINKTTLNKTMLNKTRFMFFFVAASLWIPTAFAPCAQAQTLGGIVGTVTELHP